MHGASAPTRADVSTLVSPHFGRVKDRVSAALFEISSRPVVGLGSPRPNARSWRARKARY